jgi:DNA-binding XRE family transcriptional regulator
MIKKNKHQSDRPLSDTEQAKLDAARKDVAAHADELLDEAREAKAVWNKMRVTLRAVLSELKAERERQGLSLADMELRSGLKKSALSRLENDTRANPTLLTLQRYADALGRALDLRVAASERGRNS